MTTLLEELEATVRDHVRDQQTQTQNHAIQQCWEALDGHPAAQNAMHHLFPAHRSPVDRNVDSLLPTKLGSELEVGDYVIIKVTEVERNTAVSAIETEELHQLLVANHTKYKVLR